MKILVTACDQCGARTKDVHAEKGWLRIASGGADDAPASE